MLVPVYAESDADQGKVTVSPRIQQNLGVRTAPVVEGTLSPQVSAVGNIAFNERDQSIVQARATGYVERLHVRATLDRVAKGQPLADLYVPDWIAAQEEFLGVRAYAGREPRVAGRCGAPAHASGGHERSPDRPRRKQRPNRNLVQR